MNRLDPGTGFIFMKVGIHAGESIDDIIKRKQDEFARAGKIFWGYGGNTCHPRTLVQPFVRKFEGAGKSVHLIMHKMESRHWAPPEIAKEYSEDGVEWYPVPDGIDVRGSRYGMVIGGLTEDDFDLNLKNAIVSVGPSRGMVANNYLRGQVDKGCFEVVERAMNVDEDSLKHIDITAPLIPPYAVFLR